MPDDEERACQKFAKVFVSPSEIEAPGGHDHGCSYVKREDHAFLSASPRPRMGCFPNSALHRNLRETGREPKLIGAALSVAQAAAFGAEPYFDRKTAALPSCAVP
jgi:hypothetical protein